MKYYLGEYWKMMNSDSPDIREEGEAKWTENAKKYGPYFETIREKLPKRFMYEFEKNCWFHDFAIDNINISSAGGKNTITELCISHGESAYKITFTGVRELLLNLPNTRNLMRGKLTWGYSEFEFIDEATWILRILCDLCCEFEIMFKRISIRKL